MFVILTESGSKNMTGVSMDSWTENKIVRGSSACVEEYWSASFHLVYNSGNACGARTLRLEVAGIASGCYVDQTDQEVPPGDHHVHGMVYLDLGKVVDCNDLPFQIDRRGTAEDSSNEMENGSANGKGTFHGIHDHFELEGRPQTGEVKVNEGEANLRVLL